jgi:Domain of unknown function (DUF4145)
MALPDDWEGNFQNNALTAARMRCPHCENASTFAVLYNLGVGDGALLTIHAVLQCHYPQCRKLVYVQTSKPLTHTADQRRDVDWLRIFPKRRIDQVHKSIPVPVAEDWIEAQKAFNENAVKAAAVMCRRVLYGVLLDKKCKEHPLHEGIAELVAQARLPHVVEQWLTEIKDDGHDAAHPFRALNVPAENVAETMEYTKELLRFVYIEPYDLQQRLARKAAQVTAKP